MFKVNKREKRKDLNNYNTKVRSKWKLIEMEDH